MDTNGIHVNLRLEFVLNARVHIGIKERNMKNRCLRDKQGKFLGGKPVVKICKTCNKKFQIRFSHASKTQFCSFSCRFPNRKKIFKKSCEVCHKSYIGPKNRSLKEWLLKSKYCSIKCMGIAKRGLQSWNHGKTYNELFGQKKAAILKSEIGKFSSNRTNWAKGKTKLTHPSLMQISHKLKGRQRPPDVIKKCLSFRSPNKVEIVLAALLDSLYPTDWKFVGNGAFIIGGKNPDFININGKKLIIELFGEHWHEASEVRPRSDAFAKYGYKTLILWDYELNNKENMVNKIKALYAV